MSMATLRPAEPSVSDLQRVTNVFATTAAWWTVLACVCAVLLAPLFVVDVPPLLDYPNHLARIYVLAFGDQDPFLSRMYAQHWALIPNLAIDLVMPPLARLLPIHVAGRVMLAAGLLAPTLGVVVYHRAAFRARSYWPMAAALVAYNSLFVFGFVNYLIGLGAALLVAAAWLRWCDAPAPALVVTGAAATALLFFIHLFSLVFLAILIGASELGWLIARRHDRAEWRRRLVRDGLIGLAAFSPAVALYAMAPISGVGGTTSWTPYQLKVMESLESFSTYDGRFDIAFALVFLGGLWFATWRGALRAAPGAVIALGLTMIAYVASPFFVSGTAFVDSRFPIMTGLLLFAGLRWAPQPSGRRIAIALALTLAFLARTASLAEVWYSHNEDVSRMRQTIASVPPGARTLVVSLWPKDAPDYWDHMTRGRENPNFAPYGRLDFHLAALLTIERRAFWPLMFAAPSKQPLRTLPPYDRLAAADGSTPPPFKWLALAPDDPAWVHILTTTPYLRDWSEHFDYVLLLLAGGAGDLSGYLPGRLELVERTDVAALFKVRRP